MPYGTAASRIHDLLPHSTIEDGSFGHVDLLRTSATRIGASVTLWSSPADGAQAGGDWCDVVTISDESVAFTVGDVLGHGEAIAGTMAAIRASVLRAIHDIHVPSDVLSVANTVAVNRGDGVIVTAVVSFLNHCLQTLTFANAGHPPPSWSSRCKLSRRVIHTYVRF